MFKSLFITFFLLFFLGLFIYEDIFINSLKGLYPEFVTPSAKLSKTLQNRYKNRDFIAKEEVFVHSEEISFSYDGKEDLTKLMNVRTYANEYKYELFNTLKITKVCNETNNTIWMSSRLYNNMSQDTIFDRTSLYFKDEDDNYHKYNICQFDLDNDEKWLLISSEVAKNIAYLPFPKYVLYTDEKDIKEQLYTTKAVNSWKKYLDYDDLGIFLLAKEVSNTFLTTFFIFLITFMIIAFSSLAKEFEASIFLTKLYGLNIYRSIALYTFFFLIYTLAIALVVYVEYNVIVFFISSVTNFAITLDINIFYTILKILAVIGFVVSIFMSLKYHRLPL